MQPTKRPSIYDEITSRVLQKLESGVESWQRPWRTIGPVNALTNRAYRGINILLLGIAASERGYASNGWVAFRAAAAAGGHVTRGERATTIVWWERRVVTSSEKDISEIADAAMCESRSSWLTRTYSVFNLDQCEGLASLREQSTRKIAHHELVGACERIVVASGARIRAGGASASYCPATDTISLPALQQFSSADSYYATLFHELTHWTGAPDRLNRKRSVRFGSDAYAFEELVAELGAAFLCGRCAIPHVTRAAAYLDGWLRVLRSDSRAIVAAARLASASSDYLAAEDANSDCCATSPNETTHDAKLVQLLDETRCLT